MSIKFLFEVIKKIILQKELISGKPIKHIVKKLNYIFGKNSILNLFKLNACVIVGDNLLSDVWKWMRAMLFIFAINNICMNIITSLMFNEMTTFQITVINYNFLNKL